MLRRALAHLMLAMALLFAQQGGLAHEFSHVASDASQPDKPLPHSKFCQQCASYAQLGSGAIVQPAKEMPADVPCPGEAVRPLVYPARHFIRHPSRAPPLPFSSLIS